MPISNAKLTVDLMNEFVKGLPNRDEISQANDPFSDIEGYPAYEGFIDYAMLLAIASGPRRLIKSMLAIGFEIGYYYKDREKQLDSLEQLYSK